ncbi:hypothetical protein ABT034_28295 [Streptomyces sp. NPDC002773]|uniref:hypothetical protein n=1 Tax=Streptomyces sp. NPDC002773 TaxID=3154430 RepID=UPI003317153A
MTTDLPPTRPAEDEIEPTAGPARGPTLHSAVSPPPAPGAPPIPARPTVPPTVPAVPVLTATPVKEEPPAKVEPPVMEPQVKAEPLVTETPARQPYPARAAYPVTVEPPVTAPPAGEAPPAAVERPAKEASPAKEEPPAKEAPPVMEPQLKAEPPVEESQAQDENGDEAVHTLLRTAATERPVAEVAALVARLQETGAVSSPADVALRAAAVTRPLDEVRQLLALLNASGYDLHQAETTLRAAAVGRPIEDVVRLVGILGTDSSDWQPPGERKAAPGQAAGTAAAAATGPKRGRGAAEQPKSTLDGGLATGPGSHSSSPALRSALRWPTAVALFVCGLLHLPTDLAGLRSGGDAETVSVVVTVLCVVAAVWLAARDTLLVWAAVAGLAIVVIALHGVASARTVDLLSSSLGTTFAWAKALALLSAVAVVLLTGTAVVRHTRMAGAADST